MSRIRPVAPDLFTDEPEPHLLGGVHRETGAVVFPRPAEDPDYETIRLPRQGRLWSYTVQRFPPKSPPYAGSEPFEPFAVGYVELPGALIVESRLTGIDFDALRLDLPVELTTVPLRADPDGTTITTFAFRPTAGGAP